MTLSENYITSSTQLGHFHYLHSNCLFLSSGKVIFYHHMGQKTHKSPRPGSLQIHKNGIKRLRSRCNMVGLGQCLDLPLISHSNHCHPRQCSTTGTWNQDPLGNHSNCQMSTALLGVPPPRSGAYPGFWQGGLL